MVIDKKKIIYLYLKLHVVGKNRLVEAIQKMRTNNMYFISGNGKQMLEFVCH